MRIVALIQARMGSSRFPGKVLARIAGRAMLVHVAQRARAIPGVHEVAICTTPRDEDDAIVYALRGAGIRILRTQRPLRERRGANDVLGGYAEAAVALHATTVIRLTSDCPLLDPAVAGAVLLRFLSGHFAYASNVHPPSWFDGCDVEVLSARSLRVAAERAGSDEREHVTTHLWRHPEAYPAANVACPDGADYSRIKLSVDTAADLALVDAIARRLAPEAFGWRDTLAAYDLVAPSPIAARAARLYTARPGAAPLRAAYIAGARAGADAATALAARLALTPLDEPAPALALMPHNPFSVTPSQHARRTAWALGWEDAAELDRGAALGLTSGMSAPLPFTSACDVR